MPAERITVTFPPDLVREIDRRERNRSKFIQQAVRQELERQRRTELEHSLRNPHPETPEVVPTSAGSPAKPTRGRRSSASSRLDQQQAESNDSTRKDHEGRVRLFRG